MLLQGKILLVLTFRGRFRFGEKRRKLKKKLKRAASIAAGGARFMSRSSDMDTSVEVTDSSA